MNATKFFSVFMSYFFFVSILVIGGGISISLILIAINAASYASITFLLTAIIVAAITACGLKVQLEELLDEFNN